MKRAMIVTGLVAMGVFAASVPALAQDAPAKTSGGQIVIGALGVEDIGSSKFQEYREVPKGLSIPYATLFATAGKVDFNLTARNIRQTDQRYTGWFNAGWMGLSFDYNQIPHNMGNDARLLHVETAPGVWSMSDTLQRALGSAVDATVPTTLRTYDFYAALMAPTLQATNSVDVSSQRNRGTVEFSLLHDSPLALSLTYMREARTGYKGFEGGGVYSAVNSIVEVPGPLDSLTQDFGLRAAFNFKAGNVHAAFNRNVYNNQIDSFTIDNPFQGFDTPYLSTPTVPVNIGGGSRARWATAPDNEASTTSGGFLLKFAGQTRLSGDLAFATWTQDAAFIPYTINSAITTPSGAAANSLSALQQPSLNGKINTTTLNFMFSSRPIKGLGLRASYRSYDLANKTTRFIITGDVAGSPDRAWSTVSPSADAPYGHATANPYDTKTSRFAASVTYDFGDLTIEGAFRNTQLERTHREAETGEETGVGLAAIYRAADWLKLMAKYDDASRTAEGHTVYGFQFDEAERDTTRTALEVEIRPVDSLGFTFAYGQRDVEYPNRPDRVPVASGVPVAGQGPYPGTPSGLLEAKYDTYTAEFDFVPNARVELGAYYTYEKDASTVQWSTTNAAPVYGINNLLNYKGSDATDTFGANAVLHLVPEKWTFTFNAMHQKVDGLVDITAREAGSFYTPGRTTLIPAGQGGAADITDYDDTTLTTVTAQLAYDVDKAWTVAAGYMYEKYDFKDAFTSGTTLMPASISFFTKADNGPYTANVVYAKLSYKF